VRKNYPVEKLRVFRYLASPHDGLESSYTLRKVPSFLAYWPQYADIPALGAD
jgi:hypothetical protein